MQIFFEQAVLKDEVGHGLFEGSSLATKVLHLAGRRSARGVAGKPTLAGLQELLRPAVMHRGGDTLAAHSSEMVSSPRSPSSTMRIFSSAE